MKKKILLILLSLVLVLSLVFVTACNDNNGKDDDQILAIYNLYVANAESNGEKTLSYSEWLTSISGVDGKDGKDGVSVTDVKVELITENGVKKWQFTFTMSEGSPIICKVDYDGTSTGGGTGEGGGQTGGETGGETADKKTETIKIADYASANSWESGKRYETINGTNFTATASGTASGSNELNTGKYYSNSYTGATWRVYSSESGTVTLTAKNDAKITSVTITYEAKDSSKGGELSIGGTVLTSGEAFTTNANSVVIEATKGTAIISEITLGFNGATGGGTSGGEEGGEEGGETEKTPESYWANNVEGANLSSFSTLKALIPNSDDATTEKYYAIGKITAISNTTYGNMTITDKTGSETIDIYGLYDSDGTNRYDALTTKPAVGDVIVVYGKLSNYKGTQEFKDAWLMQLNGEALGTVSEGGEEGGETTDIDKTTSLATAIANTTNYTMTFTSVTDGETDYTETYKVSDGKMVFQFESYYGDTYTEYIDFANNFYYSEWSQYYKVDMDSDLFADFNATSYYGLGKIDASAFTQQTDGTWKLTTNVDANAKKVLYDNTDEYYSVEETYTSLVITIKDGKIAKIVANSNYVYDSETYKSVYTLTFGSLGTTASVTLPEAVELTEDNYDDYFDEDGYEIEEGEGGGSSGGEEGGEEEYDYEIYNGLPSTGDVKALVIPVQFSNDKFSTEELTNIGIAFNGTKEQTGWHSAKTYYEESSYNQLHLDFTIGSTYTYSGKYSAFQTAYSKYYADYQNVDNPIDTLIDTVLASSAYSSIKENIDDYDSDKDGNIDAIYVIYSCAMDYNGDDDSCWWAWTDLSYSEVNYGTTESELYIAYYVWMSVDFLSEPIEYGETEASDKYVTVNAQTIIHESGHMLGLNDYYDYTTGKGPEGGLGGGDMMDYNVGDHNAASKMILGWINAENGTLKEVSATETVTISALSTAISETNTAKCIVIRNPANEQEYIVIDLYLTGNSISGVNDGYNGLPSINCIRIFHVNATENAKPTSYWPFGIYKYDNSDTTYKFIEVVEQDGDNSIESVSGSGYNKTYGELATDSDYYVEGNSLASFTWDDKTSATFTISIGAIDATNGTASVTVTFSSAN